jgi:hypothetical protein
MSLAPGAKIVKDPNAVLPYKMDWTAWLGASATIVTSAWSQTDPADGALAIDSESHDDTTATIIASGGTVGQTYKLTNHIVTDETPTREDDRSFYLQVRER